MKEGEFKTSSIQETADVAKLFLDSINPNERIATVVSLYGDLGAGKTAFTQSVGKLLGVEQSMQSPTFVIMKRYELQNSNYKNLIHIDAYRLKNGEDLTKLGFADLLKNPQNLIFIEWADLVEDIIPRDAFKIYFKHISENERNIVIK